MLAVGDWLTLCWVLGTGLGGLTEVQTHQQPPQLCRVGKVGSRSEVWILSKYQSPVPISAFLQMARNCEVPRSPGKAKQVHV